MIEFIVEKKGKLSKIAPYQVEGVSYSLVMKLLRKKNVKVNDARVKEDVTLEVGDKVVLFYTIDSNKKFSIIYQDEKILVINKFLGYTSESVYSDIQKLYSNARFVHRLDRNTSGIMIFGFGDSVEELLINGFKNRDFKKLYLAEVKGVLEKKSDVLVAYLFKDAKEKFVKISDKKLPLYTEIKTGYRVVREKENSSVLEVELFTGKTHQIRAHLSHIGHPIIGDEKYGDHELNKRLKVKSQRLTAFLLTLKFSLDSELAYLNDKTFRIDCDF